MIEATKKPRKTRNKSTKKPSQEAVITFLQSYKDPRHGLCTPSNKEIASAVGVTPGTVSDITGKLVKSGRLEKTRGWEYCVDGDDWIFTTDRWEAVSEARNSECGEFTTGPNLYRVIGVLLLFVVLWPTVAATASPSVYEALCYKSAIGVLLALLAKIFFGPPSRATIRCSDCGCDFTTDKAFLEHECAPGDLDYLIGSNV